MIRNTKTYTLIFVILTHFTTPAYSKFGTDSPLTQSYIDLSKQKYFLDKSLLIQDLFEKYCFNYFYVTAPKGFGKTTIANMIHFFSQAELNGTNQRKHFRNTVAYKFFKNRKISRSKKVMEKHLSRYSVIRLDLRIHPAIGEGTEEVFLKRITTRIQNCFREYKWILPIIRRQKFVYFGRKHAKLMINYIEKAILGRLSPEEAVNGLFILSRLLHLHFRKSVIVIIDNYDYLMERFVRKGKLVGKIYDFIDRLIFETFETGEENVYLGFIFGVSGLPMGKINENVVPDYVVIGDEYSEDEQRKRMYRWAFLEDHVFTGYLGFNENDLMVLNRKYNSNETEKILITRRFGGYRATKKSLFYNSFSVCKYFIDKTTDPNSTQMQMNNRKPLFDKSKFIARFINKDTVREKILRLMLHDEINLVIEKTYKKPIYLHELLEPNSETSPADQADQIFTYFFEQGYLTHDLDPDRVSIPNLEIKEYLLKQLKLNYEEMKIDVKQCGEILESIFEYFGDQPILLGKDLEEILQREFSKVIEVSETSKLLEYQAIVYVAAFHTKYRTDGEIMLALKKDNGKGAQVLLLDSRKERAMIVEVKKENEMDENEREIYKYNLANITRIKYLNININENGPMVTIV